MFITSSDAENTDAEAIRVGDSVWGYRDFASPINSGRSEKMYQPIYPRSTTPPVSSISEAAIMSELASRTILLTEMLNKAKTPSSNVLGLNVSECHACPDVLLQ